VLFPLGPQSRGRLGPRAAVGRRLLGGLDVLPVPGMGGDLLLPADGRRLPPLPAKPGIRPAVAAVALIAAIGGPSIGLWLVDPHQLPVRNWQAGAPIIGKRTGRPDGS
jgi:hypothetical protein